MSKMRLGNENSIQLNAARSKREVLCEDVSLELTSEEAAEFLHCSRREIYYLLKRRELDGTYYRIGRRVFFNKEKLQEWKDAGGTEHIRNNI